MNFRNALLAILGAVVMLPCGVARADDQPIEAFVETYAQENLAASRAPGMVFVRVDEDGITTRAFGFADVEARRPMTPATPLRVGSISKPITAAIALELTAAGELDLDRPVDSYLDVDLGDRHGPASTLRELLQHRGGYPDSIVGSHHLDPTDALGLDEWVARVPVRSMPDGVVASYSSVGYTVAGAAIAGATGDRFADVAESTLFRPLGMDGATFAQPAPPQVATGYGRRNDRPAPLPLDATDLVPGAGLTATGDDIGAFMRALLDSESPLAQTTVDGLLEPAGPGPGLRGFTTGLTEWRYDGRTVLYHEGNGIGTTSRMMILPDQGVGIFTAVNGVALTGTGDPSAATRFVRELHQRIVERFYPPRNGEAGTPDQDGRGVPTDAAIGTYVPTRVDVSSPLRLEAIVAQSEVTATAAGIAFDGRPYVEDRDGFYRGGSGDIRFLEGPDGVTYATMGGTSSFRRAAWWEEVTPNAVLLVGSLATMLIALAFGIRPASARERLLMIGITVLALGFVGLLGFGLATVEVMDLFTGLSPIIRLAQVAAVGLGTAGVIGLIRLVALRRRLSSRVLGSMLGISLAGLALTGWALMWRILPM